MGVINEAYAGYVEGVKSLNQMLAIIKNMSDMIDIQENTINALRGENRNLRAELYRKAEGLSVGTNVEKMYNFVKENCKKMDAVYEDYLIRLVGEMGLDILKRNKLIESCGSIEGRKLYTLLEK